MNEIIYTEQTPEGDLNMHIWKPISLMLMEVKVMLKCVYGQLLGKTRVAVLACLFETFFRKLF